MAALYLELDLSIETAELGPIEAFFLLPVVTGVKASCADDDEINGRDED